MRKKIDEFIIYAKQNEEIFKFVHNFYAVSERNEGWGEKQLTMNKLYLIFLLL